MKNIFNKTNAPYLVSGALATAALLTSGVFAVAPYIGFLAPVAALSVSLPLIVVGAVFSVVAIALSCAAISKNNTIAEKNKVIDQKTQDIEYGNKVISKQTGQLNQKNTEISRLKEQLAKKEIIDVRNYKNSIDEKGVQTAEKENSSISRLAEAAVAGTMAAGGVAGWTLGGIAGGMLGATVGQLILGVYVDNSKEGEARKKATVDNVWDISQLALGNVKSSMKNAYDSTIECSKGALNSVGTVLNSVCDAIAHPTAKLVSFR